MRGVRGNPRRPGRVLVVVAAATLLAACNAEAPLLDPARLFACDPSGAGVEPPPPPPPPALSDAPAGAAPAPPPMSADAAAARQLFDAERWPEAEAALRRVASGAAGDDTAHRQLAEHDLGIVLYRENKLEASLTVFLSIAANPAHERHAETSVWLWNLARKGPPYLDRAARALAAYPLATTPDLGDDHLWQAWWGMLQIVGRSWFRAGRYDDAVSYFERIPPRSEAYPLARRCLAVICGRPVTPAACGPEPRGAR
jgi:tetratricopeptide (TPR) repeat protein